MENTLSDFEIYFIIYLVLRCGVASVMFNESEARGSGFVDGRLQRVTVIESCPFFAHLVEGGENY